MDQGFSSGPLVVGKAVFWPRRTYINRQPCETFGGFPFHSHLCPVPQEKVDVDQMNREYEVRKIAVDKRTHRIRFEGETENEVTIVVEPK